MITIRLDPNPLPRLQQMSDGLRWALERAISRTAQEGAVFMKQELARQRLAATSLLINSVAAEATEEPLTWRFGPHVEHGWWVYQGRRPGGKMPPIQAIRDWVRVKRLSNDPRLAWAVARKIQQQGTPARDYVTPTLAFAQQRLQLHAVAALQDATGAA